MSREQWPDDIPDWIADPSDALRTGNHVVPVTHLRWFTDDCDRDGLLWMYDRKDPGNPKHLPAHEVAKINGLYVLGEDVPLRPRDVVERFLDYVEKPYPRARRWLIHGPRVGLSPKPPTDLWVAFCVFVAMQYQRTPHVRDQYVRHGTFLATAQTRAELEDLERFQARIEREQGEQVSKEELRAFRDQLDAGELEIGPGSDHWLVSFGDVALRSADHLMDLPFRVLRAPPGVEFPTSDLPVCLAKSTGADYRLGGGFRVPGSEVTLPLSPRHVLVAGPGALANHVGTDDWYAGLADRLAHHSRRFVYSRDRDPRISEVLRRTEPPRSVLEFGGKEYSLDGPIGPIAKEFVDERPSTVWFSQMETPGTPIVPGPRRPGEADLDRPGRGRERSPLSRPRAPLPAVQ